MQAPHGKLRNADVIAVFENQDDADEAILQLRLHGFRDRQIGYFVSHPTAGLINLYDRSYAGVGAVIGGLIGAALGVGAAWLLNQWSVVVMNVHDFFGLIATCVPFTALFVGFIGWAIGVGIQRGGVETPPVDPKAGPLILALSAGDAQERAWGIIHRNGGHELPPGAMMAQPGAA